MVVLVTSRRRFYCPFWSMDVAPGGAGSFRLQRGPEVFQPDAVANHDATKLVGRGANGVGTFDVLPSVDWTLESN